MSSGSFENSNFSKYIHNYLKYSSLVQKESVVTCHDSSDLKGPHIPVIGAPRLLIYQHLADCSEAPGRRQHEGREPVVITAEDPGLVLQQVPHQVNPLFSLLAGFPNKNRIRT